MTSKKFKHTSLEKWDTLDNCSSCSLPSNGSFLHFQAFILAMIFSFNGLPSWTGVLNLPDIREAPKYLTGNLPSLKI